MHHFKMSILIIIFRATIKKITQKQTTKRNNKERGEMEEEPGSGEKRNNWKCKGGTEKQAEKDIGRGKREGLKKRLEENQASYGLRLLSKAQDFIWKKDRSLG